MSLKNIVLFKDIYDASQYLPVVWLNIWDPDEFCVNSDTLDPSIVRFIPLKTIILPLLADYINRLWNYTRKSIHYLFSEPLPV